ncbi:uncharacterized protein si:dkey-261h17.1 isoform X2 [Cyclopterus lumpus]|uniref:uncharacterized protein si:dkey-261h17.1 isoform X2 n=1 Tax=Cyclopterus lumpus TaxID=8103 RepID=UPI001486BF00|nr:uncharacterized protein si:dkey-261h17.1 isoform X2 [Cyclopterus lumpus]
MAASMWRMNGPWRRMAGVLLLCALMLSMANGTADEGATPTVAVGGESAASAAPQNSTLVAFQATIVSIALGNSQDGDTSGTTGTTADPIVEASMVPDVSNIVRTVVPNVMCVGKEDIPENNAVKAALATADCQKTKDIIQQNPASWCHKENCNLKIFQDGNTALVASDDANLATLADALKSEHLKDKLGVTKTETPPSSGSSVFVGILVTGLLAALAIPLGYLKCQRRTDTKGVRLAEEAHPADQENQGNTLVSVAPLIPPPETTEKPSINGDSPEADKTQPPPPINGHSTTKTADTEM